MTKHLYARVTTLPSTLRSSGGPNDVLEGLFQKLFKTCNTLVYTELTFLFLKESVALALWCHVYGIAVKVYRILLGERDPSNFYLYHLEHTEKYYNMYILDLV